MRGNVYIIRPLAAPNIRANVAKPHPLPPLRQSVGRFLRLDGRQILFSSCLRVRPFPAQSPSAVPKRVDHSHPASPACPAWRGSRSTRAVWQCRQARQRQYRSAVPADCSREVAKEGELVMIPSRSAWLEIVQQTAALLWIRWFVQAPLAQILNGSM